MRLKRIFKTLKGNEAADPSLVDSQLKARLISYSVGGTPAASQELTPFQIERIKMIQTALREVLDISLEKTLENFSGDANPEKEIVIFEAMVRTYQEQIEEMPGLTLPDKVNIYGMVLRASFCSSLEMLYEYYPEKCGEPLQKVLFHKFERIYESMIAERQ